MPMDFRNQDHIKDPESLRHQVLKLPWWQGPAYLILGGYAGTEASRLREGVVWTVIALVYITPLALIGIAGVELIRGLF